MTTQTYNVIGFTLTGLRGVTTIRSSLDRLSCRGVLLRSSLGPWCIDLNFPLATSSRVVVGGDWFAGRVELLVADPMSREGFPAWARGVTSEDSASHRFSICTLVTDKAQYTEMVASFVGHGFAPDDCEFLYIDNTAANSVDAYEGYNSFLAEARGRIIILCHQDIELLEDDRHILESRIAELERVAPDWALCGNSGGTGSGARAIRISDPHGANQSIGELPARVVALDENFIAVRRSANLALSQDLAGFHHYGADMCIVADILGFSAWVIDFHLLHKSGGNASAEYADSLGLVTSKWRRALRSRWVTTPCASYFVSGLPISNRLVNKIVAKAFRAGRRRIGASVNPDSARNVCSDAGHR